MPDRPLLRMRAAKCYISLREPKQAMSGTDRRSCCCRVAATSRADSRLGRAGFVAETIDYL